MTSEAHWRDLERIYLAAPINRNLRPRMIIGDGICTVRMSISDSMHHTANALHGSIYFKMLDEAALFAANSLEPEVFMLTSSFNTYLTRPDSEGVLFCERKAKLSIKIDRRLFLKRLSTTIKKKKSDAAVDFSFVARFC